MEKGILHAKNLIHDNNHLLKLFRESDAGDLDLSIGSGSALGQDMVKNIVVFKQVQHSHDRIAKIDKNKQMLEIMKDDVSEVLSVINQNRTDFIPISIEKLIPVAMLFALMSSLILVFVIEIAFVSVKEVVRDIKD